jgi:hypothetical protein
MARLSLGMIGERPAERLRHRTRLARVRGQKHRGALEIRASFLPLWSSNPTTTAARVRALEGHVSLGANLQHHLFLELMLRPTLCTAHCPVIASARSFPCLKALYVGRLRVDLTKAFGISRQCDNFSYREWQAGLERTDNRRLKARGLG